MMEVEGREVSFSAAAAATAVAAAAACLCYAPVGSLQSPSKAQQQRRWDDEQVQIRCGESEDGSPVYLSPPQIGLMRDSTKHLRNGDFDSLREVLERDGYLYIRGLLDRDKVLSARATVVDFLAGEKLLRTGEDPVEAMIASPTEQNGVLLAKHQDSLVRRPEIMSVLEAPKGFFDQLFGSEADTFPYKWLRAVAQGEFTGAHIDSVYMGRGSSRLTTCWIPFGDIPLEQGTLLVCPRGTAQRPGPNERIPASYKHLDVDSDQAPPGSTGQFTTDPNVVTQLSIVAQDSAADGIAGWVTADFAAGDCVILPMDTLHMSTTNTTEKFRISCDTRWQPASDPHDERWATDAGWRRQLDPQRLAERGEEGATEARKRPSL
eukprot:COSAG05_NODE_10_length_39559_cov_64.255423_20_plen_377_part_00